MGMARDYANGDNADGSGDTDADYKIRSDADTLKKHAEITGDPERHAAAHAHMQAEQMKSQSALDASHKQLRGKVRKGLKKAFGPAQSEETPFQKAGKSGGTPYDDAEGK